METTSLIEQIDRSRLPKHLAVIMDGNGRWAKQRGLKRTSGHRQGAESVKEAIKGCGDLGIPYLTLYAFSTENWNRPKLEVRVLMDLLVSSLKKEVARLHENEIRLHVIGNTEALPAKARRELKEVVEKTAQNQKTTLTLALSYGGREELTRAVKLLCAKVKNEGIPEGEIDEATISEFLYTRGLPDVDLLIRTSGEQRISNFLLWQVAYAELYFTPTLWPDFKREDLFKAIINYQNRERRFGKTSEQLK